MKNRITLLNSTRIILDHVVGYTTWDDDDEEKGLGDDWPLTLFFSHKTDETIVFDNPKERNAFLARLDNYFQEIA
jgi:hypothetical protein